MITEVMQDYLKIIYELREVGESLTTSNIAAWLGISSPSVTQMLQRLATMGLVEYEPYRGVALTAEGEAAALEVVRHHRLLERFLMDVVGMSWDQVHAEAHRLEHALSEDLEDRLAEMLGDPSFDPHGRAIPDREGGMPTQEAEKLSEIEPGRSVRVVAVDDEDPMLLRYVGGLRLYPGEDVEIVARSPFGGPLQLRVRNAICELGIEAARHIWVRVV